MSDCYHCGLPVPGDSHFRLEIAGRERALCCPGCLAVAAAIVDGGLDNFYRYRSADSQRPRDTAGEEFSAYDLPEVSGQFVQPLDNDLCQAELLLEGISCAACAWLIENHLGKLPGLQSVRVNVEAHRVTVRWQPSRLKLSTLMAQCQAIGYKPFPASADAQQELWKKENQQALRRLGVAGIGMMQVGMVAIAIYAAGAGIDFFWQQFLRVLSLIIVTPVVFYAAAPFFSASWKALKSRHLIMDVPVALAIGGAYSASTWATLQGHGEVYFDSIAMFTFFLLLGRYLEMRIRHRHGQQLTALSGWLPLTARRFSSGQWHAVPTAQLQVGDRVQVRPGETVPCDGEILSGESRFVEAALTGEAEPVPHQRGDKVIAGTVNTDQAVEIHAEAVGDATRLSAIETLVGRAQQDKPRIAQLADRLSSWFVGGVLVVASLVFTVWWQIDADEALWVTLSVLVVTCPCALSLATPVALTAAVARLRSLGLLVTRGHVVETLPRITRVVFDKTGTLTQGKPAVEQFVNLSDESDDFLLGQIALLEVSVTHPLARAFDQYRPASGAAQEVHATLAGGVSGCIDGQSWRFGRPDFSLPGGPAAPRALRRGTVLLLSREGQPMAWVVMADQLRPEAEALLKGLPVASSLLSGDSQEAVTALADELALEDARGGLSPEQKLDALRHYQAQGDRVLMVGDGINDVPVLSGADISVAMGGASDLARIQADAVLIHDNLPALSSALATGRAAQRIIRQNLGWALGYNLVALPLAACALVPPWAAAIGMSTSSLIVVLNALRLR